MKYFDYKGEKISRLGFGCMRFKTLDDDNGKIDKERSSKIILEAIDKGLTYIDTAYPYHDGMSEKFLGEFLEENNLREKIKLTTKLPCWLVKEYDDFYKILNEQLDNLRTDHLDFYLLHSLDIKRFRQMVDLGVFDFLNEIKEKGLSQKYLEFLQMKEEFRKKGYFDLENKKEIPKLPQKIGLITSEEGAAIVDFLSVINQKPNDIHIFVSPVKVQGESSPLMVKKAIEILDKKDLDLIVITRGGGSSEDLSSFNDSLVIEAAFLAETPIISAIGHKIDHTLLDLVADLSLQTPTEAGSYVIKNYSDISKEMKNIVTKMGEITLSRIRDYDYKLRETKKILDRKSPIREIDKRINRLTYLKKDFDLRLRSNLEYNEQKLRLVSSELKRFKDIIEIGKKNIHIKDDMGNAIFSKHSLEKSDIAFIEFSDGKVKVVVVD